MLVPSNIIIVKQIQKSICKEEIWYKSLERTGEATNRTTSNESFYKFYNAAKTQENQVPDFSCIRIMRL